MFLSPPPFGSHCLSRLSFVFQGYHLCGVVSIVVHVLLQHLFFAYSVFREIFYVSQFVVYESHGKYHKISKQSTLRVDCIFPVGDNPFSRGEPNIWGFHRNILKKFLEN